MLESPTVLLDENIPRPLVAVLLGAGVTVVHVATSATGKSDEFLLAWASREQWVLVTSDLDFPRLIYAENRDPPLILIVERRQPCDVAQLAKDVVRVLKLGEQLHGHAIVFDRNDERVRAFPQRSARIDP